jgi:hypothetical protein
MKPAGGRRSIRAGAATVRFSDRGVAPRWLAAEDPSWPSPYLGFAAPAPSRHEGAGVLVEPALHVIETLAHCALSG